MVAIVLAATASVRAQLYSVGDKAGLLAFRDGGDLSVGDAASWSVDSEPCDDGWYSREVGWRAIDCNAPGSLGGRVTSIRSVTTGLAGECLLAGDVANLAQVSGAVTIDLQGCDGVGGVVTPLATLTHLTFLALGGTSVTGSVEPLTGLAGLLTLRLAGSSVYGDTIPLRDLPGLGQSWDDFDACSAHSCLLTRLLGIDALIEQADDYTGTDDCTCCTDSCMAIGNAFCVENLVNASLPIGYVTQPTWTPWLSRDTPSGIGDYEGPGADWACSEPVAIQCEAVANGVAEGVPWNETGQVFKTGCTTSGGLICFNSHNEYNGCLDYRIRLLCPATHNNRVRLGNVKCAPAYSGSNPRAECATDSAAFNLTGCEENTCSVLTEAQLIGYEVASPAGTTVTELSNVSCAAGYTEIVRVMPESANGVASKTGPRALCAVDGGEFELMGCRENICDVLTDETQAGYVVANSSGSTVSTLLNVSCAFGYNNPVPALPTYTQPVSNGSGFGSSSWSDEDDPALQALLAVQAAIDRGDFLPGAECAIDHGQFKLTGCVENNCTPYEDAAVLGDQPWSPQKYELQFPSARTVLGLGIVRCGFGYHGRALAACPRDNGTFNPLEGCFENICDPFSTTFNATSWFHGGEERPGPVAGYVVPNWPFDIVPNITDATNSSNGTYSFIPGVTVTELGPVHCADGFHGSPVATCALHNGIFSPLTGCDENVCTEFSNTYPSIPSGYIVENPNSTTVSGLGHLGCAFGYHGRAVAACPEHGGLFANLFGCEENVCETFSDTFPVLPVGLPGCRPIYNVPNDAGTRMSELGSLSCARGYHGEAVTACPVHNGQFDALTGCSENQCDQFVKTFPTIPTGYSVSNWNGTNVTDVGLISCDIGYSAFSPRTECLVDGGRMSIKGCVESLCIPHTEEELHERGYDSTTANAVNVSGLGTLACHTTHFQPHRTIMPSAACFANESTSGTVPFVLDGCMAKDYLQALAGTVIMTLTLDANFTEISNATDRADFETLIKKDIVNLLEISIKRILVLNVTAGSIEIECMILPDENGRPISDSTVLSALPLGVTIAGYELLKAPDIFRCSGTTSCEIDLGADGAALRVDCQCTPAPIPPPPPPWVMPLWMLLAITVGGTVICCLVSWRIKRRWKNRIRPGDPYKWENGVKIYVPPQPELPGDILIAPGVAVIDFSPSGVLGSGRYAEVRRGQYTFEGKEKTTEVAFRILRDEQPVSYGQSLYEETRDFPCARSQTALSELRAALRPGIHHHNVMRLYGAWQLPDRIDGTYPVAVVEEIVQGPSLRSVLGDVQQFPDVNVDLKIRWLTEVAAGMAALHNAAGSRWTGLIHRDLKAANILLTSNDINVATVKISGHGLVLAEQPCIGTLAWKAPETFQPIVVLSEEANTTGLLKQSKHALAGAINFFEAKTGLDIDGDGDVGTVGNSHVAQVSYRFSKMSDVFSFGVVGFEVMTRLEPWAELSEVETKNCVMAMFDPHSKQATRLAKMGFPLSAQFQDWLRDNPLQARRPNLATGDGKSCPNGLHDLIKRCWEDSPQSRPTFSQCVKELQLIAETMAAVPPPSKYARSTTVLSTSGRSLVVKAIHTDSGAPVAAKQHTESNRFLRELQMLRRLSEGGARNVIIQLDGVDEKSQTLFLEMADRTLLACMDEHRKGVEEHELRMWLKKVLKALHFMHENNLAHNDIKPDNIFLFDCLEQQPELGNNKKATDGCGHSELASHAPNETAKLKLGDMQAAAAFTDPAPTQVTAYICSPELARHIRSESAARRTEGTARKLLPGAEGSVSASTALDDGRGVETSSGVGSLPNAVPGDESIGVEKQPRESRLAIARAVNFLEVKTGIDLDGDGDVGELGSVPSVARKLAVDDKSDIWAVGVMAYYLRTGVKPFTVDEKAEMLADQLKEIACLSQEDINRTLALLHEGPSKSSAAFGEFLEWCIAFDPKNRATTAQLLDCEWISGVTADEKAQHEKESELWSMFDRYDEDGSGLLDNDELMILLEEEFGYEAGDRAIDAVVETFDEDGDGNIDKQEFLELWGALENAAGAGSERAMLWYEDPADGSQHQLSLIEAGRKLTDGSLNELSEVWIPGASTEGWCRLADARKDDTVGPLLEDQMPAHLKYLHKHTTYILTVVTSDVRGAGTNAKVYVSLYGEHGEIEERKLPSKRKHFERKRHDVFKLPGPKGQKCREIGTLQRLNVRHDGSGMGSGWHLERIDVKSELSGRAWSFHCNQWLDKGEGDKQIQRELHASPLYVEPDLETQSQTRPRQHQQ
eukprot:COSAG02_NODE_1603_length_11734_cov_5.828105_5_plen_2279_part_00